MLSALRRQSHRLAGRMLLLRGVEVAAGLSTPSVRAAGSALSKLIARLAARGSRGSRVRTITNGMGRRKSSSRRQVKLQRRELRSRELHVREVLEAVATGLVRCQYLALAQRLRSCLRALDARHTSNDRLEAHVLFNW